MPEAAPAGVPVRSSMQRERTVVTGLIVLQLVLWLGFTVHRSPRFAGSATGAVLGISAAFLLVVPSLLYLAVKRLPGLKERITARLSLQTLLAWHVYGGIAGAVLAVLHTGHRFQSSLGIWLTAAVFAVVLTGYIGRHFLGMVTVELHDKQRALGPLVASYNQVAGSLASESPHPDGASSRSWRWAWPFPGTARPVASADASRLHDRAVELAGAVADLEYAIKTHTLLKRRFAVWLVAHVVASVSFYVLLVLHVWASIYFGLRWLDTA